MNSTDPTPELFRGPVTVTRALLSVSDKRGLIPLAAALHAHGVELVSTGGTKKTLSEAGIPVKDVSEITRFRECLDGRVKTLHPAVHAGILARSNHPPDTDTLKELEIKPFQLVVVNLYPFQETVAKPDVTLNTAIEFIDIGGPTMVRASAKNFGSVCILTDPSQYPNFLEELNQDQGIRFDTRLALSKAAFTHTASYDCAISAYLHSLDDTATPQQLNATLPKSQDLRYGENPQQKAAVYGNQFDYIECFHGKQLSYNNYLDTDSALSIIADFDSNRPACAIVKHTNPSGIGCADTLRQAYQKAFATDTVSPFGGILVFNQKLDLATAQDADSIFSEIIIAPDFDEEAASLLTKKANRRLIRFHKLPDGNQPGMRSIFGGMLLQQADTARLAKDQISVVSRRQPSPAELQDMLFAWKVVKHVKSNAIVFARDEQTLGIGVGQTSRVDASEFAVIKAEKFNLDLSGSVIASDAFFPFADGIEAAAKAGAVAVIQPGGSVRDAEVIEAADRARMAMVFTGIRHFKH